MTIKYSVTVQYKSSSNTCQLVSDLSPCHHFNR